MLNRMWLRPPCRNMYVIGCHNAPCVKTACGDRPSGTVNAPFASKFRTNKTTLAMSRIRTAGLMPPGPIV